MDILLYGIIGAIGSAAIIPGIYLIFIMARDLYRDEILRIDKSDRR